MRYVFDGDCCYVLRRRGGGGGGGGVRSARVVSERAEVIEWLCAGMVNANLMTRGEGV